MLFRKDVKKRDYSGFHDVFPFQILCLHLYEKTVKFYQTVRQPLGLAKSGHQLEFSVLGFVEVGKLENLGKTHESMKDT